MLVRDMMVVISTESILKMFTKQNKELKTDHWNILHLGDTSVCLPVGNITRFVCISRIGGDGLCFTFVSSF